MKRIIKLFLTLFFPWVIFLLYDNPGGALIALVMQASFIGWPFATIWAWRISHPKPHTAFSPTSAPKK